MRVVLLLLVLAGLSVGLVYVVSDDATTRTVTRRAGPRNAPRTEREIRTGYLSAALRVETSTGEAATGARILYEGPSSGESKTDEGGAASIDGLATGFYSLRVTNGDELASVQFDLRETTHLGTIRLAASNAVSGRVFDASGAPLEDAIVEAIASSDDALTELARSTGEPDAVAARATSDQDGAYELKLAGDRSYAFRAVAHGYAVAQVAKRRILGAETIDFFLQPGAAAKGRVVDPQGLPVAGALVLLVEPGLPKAETITASDGTFDVLSNPSGHPTLVVRAPGFAPYFQRGLRLPASALRIQLERGISVRLRVVDDEDRNHALPGVHVIVDMESGFASGITDGNGSVLMSNLPTRRKATADGDHVILWGDRHAARVHPILVPIPESGELDLGDLSIGRGGTVSGKVVEEGSGGPVSGATVRSYGGLPGALAIAAAATAVSANDGTFILEGVPLGATHVIALHADYAPPSELARLLSGQATAGGGPLFTEGSTNAERTIALRPAGAVRGAVRTAQGKPAVGAKITAISADAQVAARLGGGAAVAVSDADGRFTMAGLPADTTLAASHAEHGSSEATVAVADGDTVLQLRPTTALAGEVADEAGQPIANARVSIGARVLVTDERGAFRIDQLLPSTVEIRFDHPNYLPVEQSVDTGPNPGVLHIELQRGPTIVGSVVDESGTPVAGATITASLSRGQMSSGRMWAHVTSNEQGEFTLFGLMKGTYTLVGESPGHVTSSTASHPDSKERARLVLRKVTTLKGRVMSSDSPVGGAQIEALVGTETIDWTRSRADGSFSFDSLPAQGAIRLDVRHDGYAAAARDNVSPSAKDVVIDLDPGNQVGGVVQLPDNTPVPRAMVEVLVGGTRARLVTANERGRFIAGGLPEGELAARVLESGQGLLHGEPVRTSAGELSLLLIAERGESITGMVYLPDGSPAARVRVSAIDQTGAIRAAAWIDRAGQGYALRGLRAGSYTVRAECEKPALRAEHKGVPAGSREFDLQLDGR